MSQSTWLPWDPEHHELWLNSIPPEAICLENQEFPFFKVGMSDYEFQSKFCQWLHQEKEVDTNGCFGGNSCSGKFKSL